MQKEIKTTSEVESHVITTDDSSNVTVLSQKQVTSEVITTNNESSSVEKTDSQGVPNDESSKSDSSKRKESLESQLRRFKKQSSGIISEVRKREAYDKPSVKRKKKSKEARRRKPIRNGR